MALFYPLIGLINKDIIDQTDKESFLKIIARGYYYFLNNKIQTDVVESFNVHQGLKSLTKKDNEFKKMEFH